MVSIEHVLDASLHSQHNLHISVLVDIRLKLQYDDLDQRSHVHFHNIPIHSNRPRRVVDEFSCAVHSSTDLVGYHEDLIRCSAVNKPNADETWEIIYQRTEIN